MRVAHLVHDLNRTSAGVGAAACDLHRALLLSGTESFIVGHDGPGADELLSGVPAHSTCRIRPFSPTRVYGPSITLPRAVKAFDADIIHVHGLWQFQSLYALWRTRNRAVVVSPHGMLAQWAMAKPSLQKSLAWRIQDRPLLNRAAAIHCLTATEVEDVKRLELQNHTYQIPNALDFTADERPSHEGLPTRGNVRTLLFLSRLHPKKNVEALIRGWRVGLQSGDGDRPEWCLRIVGNGSPEYTARLRSLINELGLQGSVELAGPLFGAAKRKALSCADGFILPSLSEGLPMAVLEAWTFSCPVIMSAECNLSAAFESDAALRTGTSIESIGSAIQTFTALTEEQRADLARKGNHFGKMHYDWSSVCTKYVSMYRRALG